MLDYLTFKKVLIKPIYLIPVYFQKCIISQIVWLLKYLEKNI